MPTWWTSVGLAHGTDATAMQAFGTGFAVPEVVMGLLLIFLLGVALLKRFARV